jgi:phage repressor protein C with HTH and peptisase S24 domain
VDNLLKADLEKVPESLLGEMERSQDIDLSGRKLRILATTVNENNEDNVELVPVKARAGYTAGYSDPDYIKVLQSFNMPFLDRSRKYRTFPVNGDSMPPVAHGSWVTGEYVQNWSHIKSGYPHIIVTRDEGIVFKILYNKIAESRSLLLVSTNPLYNPYEVNISEVLEIWKFVHYISNEMPASDFSTANILSSAMQNIEKEIKVIKNTLREKN